jgi:integrase
VDAVTIRRASTKTNAGARVIPLNADALIALMELRSRAEKLDRIKAEHFVFPSCEHGNFSAKRPMKNWRTAWPLTRAISCPACGVVQRPGEQCKNSECRTTIEGVRSQFEGLRFHDLRHQAITELAEKGVLEQTLMRGTL